MNRFFVLLVIAAVLSILLPSSSSSSTSFVSADENTQQQEQQRATRPATYPTAENADKFHPLLVAMQSAAPPGVNFNAPNLGLSSPVTHIVEFEIVKAWRAALVKREDPANFTQEHLQSPDSDRLNKEANEKEVQNLRRRKQQQKEKQNNNFSAPSDNSSSEILSNVTNWEVLGSVLVALYGKREPELVNNFLKKTHRAYNSQNKNDMQSSFYGVNAMFDHTAPLKRRNKKDELQRSNPAIFQGHYVSARSLPKELRHGFVFQDEENEKDKSDVKNSSPSSSATVRPPWALGDSSRWLCSSTYKGQTTTFTFFDKKNNQQKEEQHEEKFPFELLSTAGTGEEDGGDEERKKHLYTRMGSLIHRDCEKPEQLEQEGDEKKKEKDESTTTSSAPFSFYVTLSRSIVQWLHSAEVANEAEDHVEAKKQQNTLTEKDKLLQARTEELHEMCKGDRVFGQIVSGFSHLRRISKLPQHRPLFARYHFLNRTRSTRSRSSSSSSASVSHEQGEEQESNNNKENQEQQNQQEDNNNNNSEQPFTDDHEEEAFSPLLEGIPMQHVSISRASIYEFNGIDKFISKHHAVPHAQPAPQVSGLLDIERELEAQRHKMRGHDLPKESVDQLKKRVEREKQIKKFEEESRDLWKHYGFARSVAAYDLESDVRAARANFCLTCAREREHVRKDFINFLTDLEEEEEEEDSDESEEKEHQQFVSNLDSRHTHLKLYFKSRTTSSRNKKKKNRSDHVENSNSNNSSSRSLFEQFVRFTGGIPPSPNVTLAFEIWSYLHRHHNNLTKTALQKRASRDPEMQRQTQEKKKLREYKKELKRRRASRRKADPFASSSDDDKEKAERTSEFQQRVAEKEEEKERRRRRKRLEKERRGKQKGGSNTNNNQEEEEEGPDTGLFDKEMRKLLKKKGIVSEEDRVDLGRALRKHNLQKYMDQEEAKEQQRQQQTGNNNNHNHVDDADDLASGIKQQKRSSRRHRLQSTDREQDLMKKFAQVQHELKKERERKGFQQYRHHQEEGAKPVRWVQSEEEEAGEQNNEGSGEQSHSVVIDDEQGN